jgi:transcriptional regulator with GAF, ATPase, and Fis domain
MPAVKRHRTKYSGVFYIEGRSAGSGKKERIYYIIYRKDGRKIEKKVGRQYQDGMTPYKAQIIRTECIQDKHSPRQEIHQQAAVTKGQKQSSTAISNNFSSIYDSLGIRLQFETLISELSARFINLPVDHIDEEIERGQKLVCEATGLHESSLVELSEDKQTLFVTHIWRAKGIRGWKRPVIKDGYEYLKKLVRLGQESIYSDPEEMPEEAEFEKSDVKKIGAASAVLIPLKTGENVLGAMSWESHGIRRDWPPALVGRLRLISEVFANALSRKRTEIAFRKSIEEIKKLKDQLQAENLYLLDEIRVQHKHQGIVGHSNSIKKVLSQIEQVAGASSTVLIQGETGTGKELVAQAIHDLSSRKNRPMVKVNCSALPPTLIETELFGHEKGAFTGAVSKRIGRFEVANGSTIFLDEIGDLPLDLQSKLLRVLEENQFERIGSTQTMTIDVRVIAATNRDLTMAVREGKFRNDLYYRLNIFPITMPPLRERTEDISLLIKAFVQEYSDLFGKKVDTVSYKTLKSLESYDWPGNIRELRNLVERAMIVSKGRALQITLPEASEMKISKISTVDDMQRKYILQVLEKAGWRIFGDRGAAKLLGMNPRTLQSRLKRLGISR